MAAVTSNGNALKHVPVEYEQNINYKEIIMAAVTSDGSSLRHVPEN